MNKKDTPLKAKPLRLPGQSVTEERQRLIDDKFEQPVLFALCLSVLAAMEWYQYLMKVPPTPVVFTLAALASIVFAAYRYWRIKPTLRQLRIAAEGERAVGQFLEDLRRRDYIVYHDVIGDGFNVDHVLIGPAGVFTVETKTWNKPDLKAEICFDGRKLTAAGQTPDRDPIVQGKAQASWLRQLLQESTGKTPPVWPVVVFPGWFVRSTPASQREAWVLEPKALPFFLDNEPSRLAAEDVKLFSFHLSRFVRSGELER